MEPQRLTTANTNERIREEDTVLATEAVGWVLALILPGYIQHCVNVKARSEHKAFDC